jgi:hypothetical protein
MSGRKFDLNIEKILEDWEVCHAIREVIANAIDEQMLTQTVGIEIFQDSKKQWHIKDSGRGLKYEHLTQRENEEKLSSPHVIGKFGIGLKDALATFDRKGVQVLIKSKYGEITLGKSEKHDFKDIVTLHAYIAKTSDDDFVGTEFILVGVTEDDVAKAKDLFLVFSGERVIEETKFGDVLEKRGDAGRIYVNGVRVAEEENFLFSYNITSLTSAIRKAMNRERTNVGRSAYSDRVRSMLLTCRTTEIAGPLVNDLRNYQLGTLHDEVGWIDVQEHAVKILSALTNAAFFTPSQLIRAGDFVDEARASGIEIVTIPERLAERIRGQVDISGNLIRDLSQFSRELIESFEFKFVAEDELTDDERMVFEKTGAVFDLIGGCPPPVREVLISETMRKDPVSFIEVEGLWIRMEGRIIVKRETLESIDRYAGVLLHEVGHSISGAPDVSRAFEIELTRLIGLVASKGLGS